MRLLPLRLPVLTIGLWIAACQAGALAAEPPTELKEVYEQVLYPCVRISTGEAAGSGTVLYSEDRGDGCQTYALTNHHVIDGAIKVETKWSSLLQADLKREVAEPVTVEVFRYTADATQDVTDSYQADVVAHDKDHDLALVKLRTSRKLDHVAAPLPKAQQVFLLEDVLAVGCALRHPPVLTAGRVNYKNDVIESKEYWLSDAQIIFGNSGGAVYVKKDRWYFIGVPSRVAVVGWSSVVTHMGYFVPVTRIREWVESQHLEFLLDKSKKPAECFEQREALRKQAEMRMLQALKLPQEK